MEAKAKSVTAEQAQGLPRVPIKASDLRRANFEALHGQGAVELDALEVVRPGEFEQLVREALEPYVDQDIADTLREKEDEADDLVAQEWDDAVADLQDEIATIGEEAKAIAEKYRERVESLQAELYTELEPLRTRIEPREALTKAYEELDPELPERPEPELEEPDEEDWLFDSNREYLEQLEYCKARKKE
jgi:hypothetical protein